MPINKPTPVGMPVHIPMTKKAASTYNLGDEVKVTLVGKVKSLQENFNDKTKAEISLEDVTIQETKMVNELEQMERKLPKAER